MRGSAAVGLAMLIGAGCGGESKAERVEAQVAQRFGPSAIAQCANGDDDNSWLCDVLVEATQRQHEGCYAWVDDDMRIVRFDTC